MEQKDIKDISKIMSIIKILALMGETDGIVTICDEWANFSKVAESEVKGD